MIDQPATSDESRYRPHFEWAWFCRCWRRHFIALCGPLGFNHLRGDLLDRKPANDMHGKGAA